MRNKLSQIFLFIGTCGLLSPYVKATCPDPVLIQCYFSQLDSACLGPDLEWKMVDSDPLPLQFFREYSEKCSYTTNNGQILEFRKILPPPEVPLICPNSEQYYMNDPGIE